MSDRKFSRRDLLGAAGAVMLGAAVFTSGNASSKAEAAKPKAASPNKWPWPYVKLDPQATAERAYADWYRISCGASLLNSVFSQLSEKVGEPYKSFPVDGFIFLEGGVAGWGTVCGAAAAANIVTNLIIGPRTSGTEDGMLMGNDILHWYSDSSLPNFTPKSPRILTEMPATITRSPLCHISVGKWMKVAGKELRSPERRDRCARVTASVAFRLVELMNDWKDAKYESEGTLPSSCGITAQQNCTDCHTSGIPAAPGVTAPGAK